MKPAASTQSNGGPKMPMAMLNFLCAMDHMAGKKPAAEASAPVGCAVGNARTCTASQIEGATSGSALPAHGTPIEHTEAAATTAGCCASPGCTGSLPPVITGAGSGRTWSIRDRYKRYEQPISREEADALRANSPSPPALNISQAPDSSASHPRVKLPFAPQPTPDASTKQKVNRSRYAGRCMTLTPDHPDYFLFQDSSDDDDEMPDLVPDVEPPLVRENHDTGASEEEEQADDDESGNDEEEGVEECEEDEEGEEVEKGDDEEGDDEDHSEDDEAGLEPPPVSNANGCAVVPSDLHAPLSCDKYRDLKKMQREPSTGYWKTDMFFPNQSTTAIKNPLNHDSVRACKSYCCHRNHGCAKSDCCSQLSDLEVLQVRQTYSCGSALAPCSDPKKLERVISEARDERAPGGFRTVKVELQNGTTCADVCISAFALIAGYTGSAFKKALSGGSAPAAQQQPTLHGREKEHFNVTLVRAYITEVVTNAHEMQPVASLGSVSGKQTVVKKAPWREKINAMQEHFRNFGRDAPNIPEKTFKQLWRAETRIVEREASSHSKCNMCADIAALRETLKNDNTAEAVQKRRFLDARAAEHETNHLGERQEMDHACLRAITSPRTIWTIMADAATQRNFELPRVLARRAKEFLGLPFFGLKLMATYAPGYGFSPFLVHDSMFSGANLLWTVVWTTILRMKAHYGYLSDELHLQVDNTCAENKNEVMIAIAAWLVSKCYFKRVRVFFLMVGHTHIIIDQIFGVITKYVKKKEILTVQAMNDTVDAAMVANPQYEAKKTVYTRALFDFTGFAKKQLGGLHPFKYISGHPTFWDDLGAWGGYHDFLFEKAVDGLATVRTRQSTQDAYQAPAQTIKTLPGDDEMPPLAECKTWAQWSKKGSKTVRDTIGVCLKHAKIKDGAMVAANDTWQALFAEIPDRVADLKLDLRPSFSPIPQTELVPAGVDAAVWLPPTNDGSDFAELIKNWGSHLFDRMMNPTFDPMVTSNQTQAALAGRLSQFRNLSRASSGPSCSANSAIFPGDWLLVRADAAAEVRLCTVTKLAGATGPDSDHLEFFANMYTHSANPGHPSGLFGTFLETKLQNAQRTAKSATSKECVKLSRAHVLIYNVDPHGFGQARRLRLSALRLLAQTVPGERYAVPSELPASHKVDVNFSDGEDSDDNDSGAQRQCATQKAKAPKAKGAGAKKPPRSGRKKNHGADDSEEEEEEEEDDDDASEEGEEEEGEEEEGEEEEGEEEEEEEEEDDDDDEARALESRQRAFAKGLQPPCFAFIHLGGSEEMLKQKYPVGLAYLTDLEEKNSSPNDHNDDAPWLFATVAWYVRHGWTTKNFPVSRKAAYTKLIVTDGSKASKKRKVSAGAAPPAETWFKETNFGISNCVVPIAVPIDLSNGPRQTVALPIDFMKKLAQVCEDYGFVAHP